MDAIMAFLNSVKNAEFSFPVLSEFFGGYMWSLASNGELVTLCRTVLDAIAPYAFAIPIVLIVLSSLQLFFGKKLLPLSRFLAAAGMGYAVGVVTISPIINNIFVLPNYVSGIVMAIVAGVLSKFIYYIGIAVGVGYISYMVSFSAAILPGITVYTKGNAVICAIVAVVAVILVLLLLKFIEMAGTAFLGAFLISELVIANYVNYPAFIPMDPTVVKYVAVGIVALIGFIVQYKTRRRY